MVQDLLNDKIEQLELQIERMALFKAELEQYRSDWKNNPGNKLETPEICPLISSVSL